MARLLREANTSDLSDMLEITGATLAVHQARQPDWHFSTDTHPVALVLRSLLSDPFSALHKTDSFALVAEQDGKVCGHVLGVVQDSFAGDDRHDRRAIVYDISLRPEARGKGLGANLLAAAIERAERLGCTTIMAEIWQGNAASAALFHASGLMPRAQSVARRIAPPLPGPAKGTKTAPKLSNLPGLIAAVIFAGVGLLAFLTR